MHTEIDRLTQTALTTLTEIALPQLRAERADCSSAETDISFVRRLTQGRLDIIGHEVQRRNGGTETAHLNEVLFEIPAILSDGQNKPRAGGRAPEIDGPTESALKLSSELDQIVSPKQLSDVGNLDDAALGELIEQLQNFEHELSTQRRQLHERIDAIQTEIVRRYREGEASVDTLLE